MPAARRAAVAYAALTLVVVLFQLALAAGAPWGALAMGGAFPGRLPPPLRAGAVVQALVLGLLAGVVLARAGVALPGWRRAARRLAWVVVAVLAVGTVLNAVTPSAGERALWLPVTVGMLACALVVARGR